jgi:hypothetical protein
VRPHRATDGSRSVAPHGPVRQEAAHVWSAHRYIRPGSVLTVELDGDYRSRQVAVDALVESRRMRGQINTDTTATTRATPTLRARHAAGVKHHSSGPDPGPPPRKSRESGRHPDQ